MALITDLYTTHLICLFAQALAWWQKKKPFPENTGNSLFRFNFQEGHTVEQITQKAWFGVGGGREGWEVGGEEAVVGLGDTASDKPGGPGGCITVLMHMFLMFGLASCYRHPVQYLYSLLLLHTQFFAPVVCGFVLSAHMRPMEVQDGGQHFGCEAGWECEFVTWCVCVCQDAGGPLYWSIVVQGLSQEDVRCNRPVLLVFQAQGLRTLSDAHYTHHTLLGTSKPYVLLSTLSSVNM